MTCPICKLSAQLSKGRFFRDAASEPFFIAADPNTANPLLIGRAHAWLPRQDKIAEAFSALKEVCGKVHGNYTINVANRVHFALRSYPLKGRNDRQLDPSSSHRL
jgi:hypothetical protein